MSYETGLAAQFGGAWAAEQEECGAVFFVQTFDGVNDGLRGVEGGAQEGGGDAAVLRAEDEGFGDVDAAAQAAAGDELDVGVVRACLDECFAGGDAPVLEGEAEVVFAAAAVVFDAAP